MNHIYNRLNQVPSAHDINAIHRETILSHLQSTCGLGIDNWVPSDIINTPQSIPIKRTTYRVVNYEITDHELPTPIFDATYFLPLFSSTPVDYVRDHLPPLPKEPNQADLLAHMTADVESPTKVVDVDLLTLNVQKGHRIDNAMIFVTPDAPPYAVLSRDCDTVAGQVDPLSSDHDLNYVPAVRKTIGESAIQYLTPEIWQTVVSALRQSNPHILT